MTSDSTFNGSSSKHSSSQERRGGVGGSDEGDSCGQGQKKVRKVVPAKLWSDSNPHKHDRFARIRAHEVAPIYGAFHDGGVGSLSSWTSRDSDCTVYQSQARDQPNKGNQRTDPVTGQLKEKVNKRLSACPSRCGVTMCRAKAIAVVCAVLLVVCILVTISALLVTASRMQIDGVDAGSCRVKAVNPDGPILYGVRLRGTNYKKVCLNVDAMRAILRQITGDKGIDVFNTEICATCDISHHELDKGGLNINTTIPGNRMWLERVVEGTLRGTYHNDAQGVLVHYDSSRSGAVIVTSDDVERITNKPGARRVRSVGTSSETGMLAIRTSRYVAGCCVSQRLDCCGIVTRKNRIVKRSVEGRFPITENGTSTQWWWTVVDPTDPTIGPTTTADRGTITATPQTTIADRATITADPTTPVATVTAKPTTTPTTEDPTTTTVTTIMAVPTTTNVITPTATVTVASTTLEPTTTARTTTSIATEPTTTSDTETTTTAVITKATTIKTTPTDAAVTTVPSSSTISTIGLDPTTDTTDTTTTMPSKTTFTTTISPPSTTMSPITTTDTATSGVVSSASPLTTTMGTITTPLTDCRPEGPGATWPIGTGTALQASMNGIIDRTYGIHNVTDIIEAGYALMDPDCHRGKVACNINSTWMKYNVRDTATTWSHQGIDLYRTTAGCSSGSKNGGDFTSCISFYDGITGGCSRRSDTELCVNMFANTFMTDVIDYALDTKMRVQGDCHVFTVEFAGTEVLVSVPDNSATICTMCAENGLTRCTMDHQKCHSVNNPNLDTMGNSPSDYDTMSGGGLDMDFVMVDTLSNTNLEEAGLMKLGITSLDEVEDGVSRTGFVCLSDTGDYYGATSYQMINLPTPVPQSEALYCEWKCSPADTTSTAVTCHNACLVSSSGMCTGPSKFCINFGGCNGYLRCVCKRVCFNDAATPYVTVVTGFMLAFPGDSTCKVMSWSDEPRTKSGETDDSRISRSKRSADGTMYDCVKVEGFRVSCGVAACPWTLTIGNRMKSGNAGEEMDIRNSGSESIVARLVTLILMCDGVSGSTAHGVPSTNVMRITAYNDTVSGNSPCEFNNYVYYMSPGCSWVGFVMVGATIVAAVLLIAMCVMSVTVTCYKLCVFRSFKKHMKKYGLAATTKIVADATQLVKARLKEAKERRILVNNMLLAKTELAKSKQGLISKLLKGDYEQMINKGLAVLHKDLTVAGMGIDKASLFSAVKAGLAKQVDDDVLRQAIKLRAIKIAGKDGSPEVTLKRVMVQADTIIQRKTELDNAMISTAELSPNAPLTILEAGGYVLADSTDAFDTIIEDYNESKPGSDHQLFETLQDYTDLSDAYKETGSLDAKKYQKEAKSEIIKNTMEDLGKDEEVVEYESIKAPTPVPPTVASWKVGLNRKEHIANRREFSMGPKLSYNGSVRLPRSTFSQASGDGFNCRFLGVSGTFLTSTILCLLFVSVRSCGVAMVATGTVTNCVDDGEYRNCKLVTNILGSVNGIGECAYVTIKDALDDTVYGSFQIAFDAAYTIFPPSLQYVTGSTSFASVDILDCYMDSTDCWTNPAHNLQHGHLHRAYRFEEDLDAAWSSYMVESDMNSWSQASCRKNTQCINALSKFRGELWGEVNTLPIGQLWYVVTIDVNSITGGSIFSKTLASQGVGFVSGPGVEVELQSVSNMPDINWGDRKLVNHMNKEWYLTVASTSSNPSTSGIGDWQASSVNTWMGPNFPCQYDYYKLSPGYYVDCGKTVYSENIWSPKVTVRYSPKAWNPIKTIRDDGYESMFNRPQDRLPGTFSTLWVEMENDGTLKASPSSGTQSLGYAAQLQGDVRIATEVKLCEPELSFVSAYGCYGCFSPGVLITMRSRSINGNDCSLIGTSKMSSTYETELLRDLLKAEGMDSDDWSDKEMLVVAQQLLSRSGPDDNWNSNAMTRIVGSLLYAGVIKVRAGSAEEFNITATSNSPYLEDVPIVFTQKGSTDEYIIYVTAELFPDSTFNPDNGTETGDGDGVDNSDYNSWWFTPGGIVLMSILSLLGLILLGGCFTWCCGCNCCVYLMVACCVAIGCSTTCLSKATLDKFNAEKELKGERLSLETADMMNKEVVKEELKKIGLDVSAAKEVSSTMASVNGSIGGSAEESKGLLA